MGELNAVMKEVFGPWLGTGVVDVNCIGKAPTLPSPIVADSFGGAHSRNSSEGISSRIFDLKHTLVRAEFITYCKPRCIATGFSLISRVWRIVSELSEQMKLSRSIKCNRKKDKA